MAIYEVTLWSIEYAENKDQVFVSIQTYNHHAAAKYPTFSICFRGTEFHWYRDINIFNSYGIDPYQYELMLKGERAIKYEFNDSSELYDKIAISSADGVDVEFNKFHVRLEDVIKEMEFVTDEPRNVIHYPNLSKTGLDKHIHLSYQSPDRICFTRSSNDPPNLVRLHDILTLNSDVFEQVIYWDTQVEIFIHYPGQLIASLHKPKYKASFRYLLSILNEFYNQKANNVLEFKISQTKVLRKRHKSTERPCNPDIRDYDKYFQLEVVKILKCVPVYWKDALHKDTNLTVCLSAENLREAFRYVSDTAKFLAQKDTPCTEMYLLSIDSVNYKPDPIPSDIAIAFRYTEKIYEEITYSKQTPFENWLSNVGGFVGIFLGYSMMQFPAFLMYIFEFFYNKKYRGLAGTIDFFR